MGEDEQPTPFQALICRLFGHKWRYHGFPEADRRRCFLCLTHETCDNGEWKSD